MVNVGDEVKKGQKLLVVQSAEVGRARADFMAAAARVNVARQQAERQRKLLVDKVTSQRAVEEAEARLRVAQADLHAARTRLSSYGAGASVKGTGGSAVVLTSPIEGTVVERDAHVGQWADPNDTLIKVMDLSQVWVTGTVFERQAHDVHVGQDVIVEVRALHDRRIPGKVDHVGATIDETTRGAPVRVVLANQDRQLKPGMFAKVIVKTAGQGEGREGLVVPQASVQTVEGKSYVFLRKALRIFEARQVEVGQQVGDEVVIRSGLTARDEIVTKGSLNLKGRLMRAALEEDD
jgi:cobalt-zinc-cadmium efflux system membrane fusion protein